MLRIFKSLLQLFTIHRLNLKYNCFRLCMISYPTSFFHVFIIVFALVLFLLFSLYSKYFRQWVKETFIGQPGNIINRFLKTNLQINTWNTIAQNFKVFYIKEKATFPQSSFTVVLQIACWTKWSLELLPIVLCFRELGILN